MSIATLTTYIELTHCFSRINLIFIVTVVSSDLVFTHLSSRVEIISVLDYIQLQVFQLTLSDFQALSLCDKIIACDLISIGVGFGWVW